MKMNKLYKIFINYIFKFIKLEINSLKSKILVCLFSVIFKFKYIEEDKSDTESDAEKEDLEDEDLEDVEDLEDSEDAERLN